MRFTLTAKSGPATVAHITGIKEVNYRDLTLEDMAKIPETEAFLERLLGLRFHLDSREPSHL